MKLPFIISIQLLSFIPPNKNMNNILDNKSCSCLYCYIILLLFILFMLTFLIFHIGTHAEKRNL